MEKENDNDVFDQLKELGNVSLQQDQEEALPGRLLTGQLLY
jgi:hypothetical protein